MDKKMEARILDWKALSANRDAKLKDRKSELDELAAMQQAANLAEQNKRQLEEKTALINQVPMRFRGLTFDDYNADSEQQNKVKQVAMRYVDSFANRIQEGSPIIMAGRPGTGKTFLSLLIYQALVNKGYTANYESSLEVISNLLSMRYKDSIKADHYFKKLSEVDFLIIDEVTESINRGGLPSEPEKTLLLRLINARYENKRCSAVITNRTHSELIQRLGQPVVDRLSGGGLFLSFDWPSYRAKQAIA